MLEVKEFSFIDIANNNSTVVIYEAGNKFAEFVEFVKRALNIATVSKLTSGNIQKFAAESQHSIRIATCTINTVIPPEFDAIFILCPNTLHRTHLRPATITNFKQLFKTLSKCQVAIVWYRHHVWFHKVKVLKDEKTPPKQKIYKRLRDKVWTEYMGEVFSGPCWACRTTIINVYNFEAGHITASAQGGDCTLDNLRPICTPCNRSCGATHLEVFKEHVTYPSKTLFY